MKTQSPMVAVIDNGNEDPRITNKAQKGEDPCKVTPYKKWRNPISVGSRVYIPVPNPDGEDIIGKVERILPGKETQALVTFIHVFPFTSSGSLIITGAEVPETIRYTITKWIALRLLRHAPEE